MCNYLITTFYPLNNFLSISGLFFWILSAAGLYELAKKSNLKYEWLAFIPFFQFIIVLHLIDLSGWYVLLLIVPILNIALLVIWYMDFFKAYRLSKFWALVMILIPDSFSIMSIIMGFSDDITYCGKNSYTNIVFNEKADEKKSEETRETGDNKAI